MYGFGMIALLGLATLAVGAIGYRYLAAAREFWALAVRDHAIAVTLTGLAIAGAGYFWRIVLEFFVRMSRKFTDQALTIERAENLRRVA